MASVAEKTASGPLKSAGGSKEKKKILPPFELTVGSDQTHSSSTKRGAKSSFDDAFGEVANLLRNRKNVIVLVGAGISTSCGIPDFRSKDCGIYNSLDIHALGLSCPEELFCYDFFQDDPVPFYKFARNLYFPLGLDQKVVPSDSHKLLALLEEKKMLLRVYSYVA